MIFVSAGTNETPFDRLVAAAAELNGGEDLLVQYGSSRVPHGRGDWREFLTFEEMRAAMSSARAVVTHAGVGSILLARACGKLPIVMPRMSEHGEAVDNHQVTFARRLEELDMLVVVEAQAELERAIAEASGTGFAHRRDDGAAAMLTHELRAFLTEQPAFASNGAANPDTVPREPSRIRAA